MPERTCTIDGCDAKHYARDWCRQHYKHWANHGDPLARTWANTPWVDRFWARVNKTETCWLWIGGLDSRGYGGYNLPGGKRVQTHRYSLYLAGVEMPEDLEVDHLCRVRNCLRPDHLELVTHAENLRRMRAQFTAPRQYKRRTHCHRGHPLSGENLYESPGGQRQCRACREIRARR